MDCYASSAMTKRIIIYHDHCADGFCAAWVAWQKYGDEAEYIPAIYGKPPPDVVGKDVLIVDFSYPRKTLLELNEKARSLMVLDHHKTAAEDLAGLPFATFDMNRSGAGLAWDELNGAKSRPWIVNYVEDRDLWRWKLYCSESVNAWIATVDNDFLEWNKLFRIGLDHAMDSGAAVSRYIRKQVMEAANNARMVTFYGYKVPIVNITSLISESVGDLAERFQFAIGWFQRSDGHYQFSLRSRGDGGVDVAELAKRLGGGGHKNAAGFSDENMDIGERAYALQVLLGERS